MNNLCGYGGSFALSVGIPLTMYDIRTKNFWAGRRTANKALLNTFKQKCQQTVYVYQYYITL